jgi:citrate synthase
MLIDSLRLGIQHGFVSRSFIRYAKKYPEGGGMKIGRQAHRASAICTSNEATILVRGRDLCEELIGRISFTEHVWLLVTGELPNEPQRRVFDAVLVAIAEHGLVPSVQAARMTLAAAPEALQGAVAAGLLGCGSVILGAAEDAGRLLHEVVRSFASIEPLNERFRATVIHCTKITTPALDACLQLRRRSGCAGVTQTPQRPSRVCCRRSPARHWH